MSSAPARGIVPHRPRRHHHHHHHHHHHRHQHDKCKKYNDSNHTDYRDSDDDSRSCEQLTGRNNTNNILDKNKIDTPESRPKVNPIFLWAAQREQRIVEVRCEDYDKRNRIKLTKTAQGWRSIPRTVLTTCSAESVTEEQTNKPTTSPTTSQNEEKENSSTKVSMMKPIKKDEFGDSRVSEMKDIEEKIKRKRKKHGSCSKTKKRKSDLEQEDDRDDIVVTTSWKMKKRKKYDKNKKRKKIRLDKEVTHNDGVNSVEKVKIKEEPDNQTKSEIRNVCETTDFEDSTLSANKDFKNCVDSSDKSIASIDEDTKRSDFEVIQNSRHFQPRVVLEQLHFPLLSTKKIARAVKSKALEVNIETNKNIVKDKLNYNGIKKVNGHLNNEHPVDVNIEETIINNEDLQEILNKLDANHIPIDTDKTKFNLIKSNELPRKCTKLGAITFANDKINDNMTKASEECVTRNSMSTALERPNKLKDKSKPRPASRSLDETIERLEKSIISQQKLNDSPDTSTVEVSNFEPKVSDEIDSQLQDKSNLENIAIIDCSTFLSLPHEDKINDFEQDDIENSKSLEFLKNKPELTVSLIDREKNEMSVKSATPVSTLPDSQTESIDNEESHSGVVDCNQFKVVPSDCKSRVDSPESTVNFSKHEVLCDTRNNEMSEVGYCKTQLTKTDKSQSDNEIYNNNNDNNNKNLVLKEDVRTNCVNDVNKDSVIDSTKIEIKKSPFNQNRCSEAQAKLLILPKYQKNEETDKQISNELCCQVSPQPSGLPSSMSPFRKSSSVYLERLLPSPPCSVSCSDDAKNDLTLTSILSASNEDLKNAGAKETDEELNLANDVEVNSAYDVPIKMEENMKLCQDKKPFSQGHVAKLIPNKQENRIMCEELVDFNSAASDCVFPKRPQSADQSTVQKRSRNNNNTFSIKQPYVDQTEYIEKSKINELEINPVIFIDPANQLRELLRTSGHLIPDPLLVPRDYLPLIASAPLTEIPNLLATRPELRLPEALTRPELLTDPDLLVISLAHLQHVLDHGEASLSKPYQIHQPILSPRNDSKEDIIKNQIIDEKPRPKLSVKPIGKLMPAPMDLSNNQSINNQKPNSKPPLLRVRSGLLKQESEVSSTASSPDDLQLWHPLFGSQKQRQQHQQQPQDQKPHQASWHRTTLTS